MILIVSKKKMVRIRNIKTYLVLGIVNKSIPSAALENPHVFLDVFFTCDHLVSCLYWYHPNPTLVSWIIIRPLASSLILNQQGYPCRLISPEHGNPANAIPLRCTVGVWHSWKSVAPLVVRFWLNWALGCVWWTLKRINSFSYSWGTECEAVCECWKWE